MKHAAPFLTLLTTITFVVSPFLTEPFSGYEADQLPVPQIDPPVQPAGYAFAIWGLIYAWLTISALFGVWKRREDEAWNLTRWPLIVSLAIGTPWLAVANTSPIGATVMICLMAAAAIVALALSPASDRWLFRAPVAIYAGWLTAASFVSLGSTLAGFGIGFGQVGWALACIGAAFIIAALVMTFLTDAPEYGATVIWALVGIVVANGTAQIWVSGAAVVGIAALALITSRQGRWSRAG